MGRGPLSPVNNQQFTLNCSYPPDLDMKLVYWALPARAHVIRAILHYHGIDYEDEGIPLEKGAEWGPRKEALKTKLAYPNLPYLEDGDFLLTESLAVAKYCAAKAGCVITDARHLVTEDMFQHFVTDLFNQITKLGNMPAGKETDQARAEFKAGVCDKLAPIERQLNKLFKWVTSDKLSWVDFFLHTVFTYLCILEPSLEKKCPNLMNHTNQLLENAGYKKFYKAQK